MKKPRFSVGFGAALLAAFCSACSSKTEQPVPTVTSPIVSIAEGRELYCLADTQEAAEDIAQQYGITLVEFRYGVASFHTEENPSEVISRGLANGWTPLSINRTDYNLH